MLVETYNKGSGQAWICYSKVMGEKTPQIFDGKPADADLMKNYEN